MRVFLRRKNSVASTAFVVVAFLFVTGGWIWASTHIPADDSTALRARCHSVVVMVGVETTRSLEGDRQRVASYLCMPDYFLAPSTYRVITQPGKPVRLTVARDWGPMGFIGVLCCFAAFYLFARPRKPSGVPDSPRALQ